MCIRDRVYAVHTDREHMHGHLIWNSVSMTTGKKYNSPKSNWKNHLQPITNKYCDELGLAIIPAEYSRNPKNISRDKWEKEMSMKEIILRDAKMCAYAAGNVEMCIRDSLPICAPLAAWEMKEPMTTPSPSVPCSQAIS